MKRFLLTTVILISFMILSGCTQSPTHEDLPEQLPVSFLKLDSSNASYSITQENSLQIKIPSYQSLSASYSISGGEPYALCSISVSADTSLLSSSDLLDSRFFLQTEQTHDINSKTVVSESSPSESGLHTAKRLIRLDENGKAEFSIKFGDKNVQAQGTLTISAPICISAENDPDYKIYRSSEKNIRFVFYSSDVEKHALSDSAAQEMAERMALFSDCFCLLTGHENVFGECLDFVFTENIPYTALAGNPIYINRAELPYMITAMEKEYSDSDHILEKTDCTAILCHELSHVYDTVVFPNTQAEYCFDKEFFAALKQIFVLKKCGYKISDNFMSNAPVLSSGIYNYEVFIKRLIDAAEQDGADSWSVMSQTLKKLSLPISPAQSVFERYNLFMDTLEEQSPSGIKKSFSQAELDILDKHFSNK